MIDTEGIVMDLFQQLFGILGIGFIGALWYIFNSLGQKIDKSEANMNKKLDDFKESQGKRFDDFKESQGKRFDDFKEYFKGSLDKIVETQNELVFQLKNHVTDTDKKINKIQTDMKEIKELLKKR